MNLHVAAHSGLVLVLCRWSFVSQDSMKDFEYSSQWRIQDLPGEAMPSVRNASLNGGLGAEPMFGGQGGLKLKAFCPFSYKKVAKS